MIKEIGLFNGSAECAITWDRTVPWQVNVNPVGCDKNPDPSGSKSAGNREYAKGVNFLKGQQ